MAEIFAPFKDKGYTIWGDNAFVSVEMLRRCKEWGINFAGTTRTTFGFPQSLIDEALEAGQWKWKMTPDGLLAAFWADVGFVKMMSNFHGPEEGMVQRREAGLADRVTRGAPVLGVEYNDKMGGTDLMDFMRGVYTTQRKSKKWWRCLYHWVLDTSMYNAFVLYQWVWNHLTPELPFKLKYREFIRKVVGHYIPNLEDRLSGTPPRDGPKRHRSPSVTPAATVTAAATASSTSSTPSAAASTTPTSRFRRRNTPSVYRGPGGETKRPPKWDQPCPGAAGGADLRKCTKTNKWGRVVRLQCKYCWNSGSVRVRVDSGWVCSLCEQHLCVECMNRYHRWINSE